MSYYYYAKIYIPKCFITDEVKKAIEEEFAEEYDVIAMCFENEIVEIINCESKWGEFEELERYLREKEIPYTRYTEGGYDRDHFYVHYRPGYELKYLSCTYDGKEFILARDIRQVVQDSLDGKLDKEGIIQRLTDLLIQNTADDLPALESYVPKKNVSMDN